MIKTELHTAGYTATDRTLVTVVLIPPFTTAPGVILWGDRVFTLHSPFGHNQRPVYVEAFAVVALHEVPANER